MLLFSVHECPRLSYGGKTETKSQRKWFIYLLKIALCHRFMLFKLNCKTVWRTNQLLDVDHFSSSRRKKTLKSTRDREFGWREWGKRGKYKQFKKIATSTKTTNAALDIGCPSMQNVKNWQSNKLCNDICPFFSLARPLAHSISFRKWRIEFSLLFFFPFCTQNHFWKMENREERELKIAKKENKSGSRDV